MYDSRKIFFVGLFSIVVTSSCYGMDLNEAGRIAHNINERRDAILNDWLEYCSRRDTPQPCRLKRTDAEDILMMYRMQRLHEVNTFDINAIDEAIDNARHDCLTRRLQEIEGAGIKK